MLQPPTLQVWWEKQQQSKPEMCVNYSIENEARWELLNESETFLMRPASIVSPFRSRSMTLSTAVIILEWIFMNKWSRQLTKHNYSLSERFHHQRMQTQQSRLEQRRHIKLPCSHHKCSCAPLPILSLPRSDQRSETCGRRRWSRYCIDSTLWCRIAAAASPWIVEISLMELCARVWLTWTK